MARRGAGRLGEDDRDRDPKPARDRRRGDGPRRGGSNRGAGAGSASDAWRRAAAGTGGPSDAPAWEPEVWIDEGAVRDEAAGAVGRGRAGASGRTGAKRGAPARGDDPQGPVRDPSVARAVPAGRRARFEERLRAAAAAFGRERYDEARQLLRPLADRAPSAESVRELLGLTYYRLGRWKQAAVELEAFSELAATTEQHPVLADCYRALGRHADVERLWGELRADSPSAALVAEGRIVMAGSLADRGDLAGAIALLERTPRGRRPSDHHLRVQYALADLVERAGDLPRARALFAEVAEARPDLADVQQRVRALS